MAATPAKVRQRKQRHQTVPEGSVEAGSATAAQVEPPAEVALPPAAPAGGGGARSAEERGAGVQAPREGGPSALVVLLAIVLAAVAVLVAVPLQRGAARPGAAISAAVYSVNVRAVAAAVEGAVSKGAGRPDAGASSARLGATFVLSSRDADTDSFLAGCEQATVGWVDRVTLHAAQQRFKLLQLLGWSHTDALGIVGHITMFAVRTHLLLLLLLAAGRPACSRSAGVLL
jgi:hypothetical protein